MTSPPAVAQELFGPGLARAQRYHDSLVNAGPVRGLNGPREVPVLWERHLINSALLACAPAELLPEGASVVDLGSGAGLTGIPLAIARPDLRLTLVDPLQRRITYLREIVAELGLDNVTVQRARAGDPDSLEAIGQFDVVTSRAVAPLGRLLRWSMPHVRPGGVLLAMKGRKAEDEIAALSASERRLAGELSVHELHSPDGEQHARVVVAGTRER
ncbi:16S rRNA (guanine(527)-N(7))-methyltransferase RsmG [Epidermidibacterium keratini]|uniref:Ribosomal RNA small subunit methyltransferase G n=1 Tax=Epidermidibacterium keratini TaxID=1891644 RepID=A0A7L4YNP0_9ACTN|nr:16S rRNA (guanine(527)-N(7))-methyltransferase RsmG [Epidermidibacterium keratini]QHC00484.1 16S rRNA (guanine(527)-N(7))-methyltransferase RsmG [Epidermidibacterium keratini]